jgi:hypothetical protein
VNEEPSCLSIWYTTLVCVTREWTNAAEREERREEGVNEESPYSLRYGKLMNGPALALVVTCAWYFMDKHAVE